MRKQLKEFTASVLALSLVMTGSSVWLKNDTQVNAMPVMAAFDYPHELKFDKYILAYRIAGESVIITGFRQYGSSETDLIITVPDEIEGCPVTEIADNAFESAEWKKLVLPDTVKKIGDHALGKFNADEFILPAGLEYLGNNNFSGAESLSLNIPAGLIGIGEYAFKDTRISKIEIDEKNEYFSIKNGMLVSEDKVFCCINDENLKSEIVIPDGIKKIVPYAFNHCTASEYKFPDSLEGVGEYAFYNSGIEKLILPEGVVSIEDSAFESCSGLTNVKFPDTLEKIGYCSFSYCSNISEIDLGKGIKEIGGCSFLDALSTDSIKIPASVEIIGTEAFLDGAAGEIQIDPENQHYSSDNGVIYDKKVIKLIFCSKNNNIEKYTVPDTVKLIESNAFCGNQYLKELTVPGNVKTIDHYAFCGCERLEKLNITGSVNIIDQCAFKNCTALVSAEFNDGLESIKEDAFINTGLKKVVLPDTVKDIGANAFRDCQDLTEAVIPVSYEFLGTNAFSRNVDIIFTQAEGYAVYGGAVFSDDMTVLIKAPFMAEGTYIVPDTVTEIAGCAFESTMVSTVILPEGLEKIGTNAFFGDIDLVTVDIPGSVTEIGENAFRIYTFEYIRGDKGSAAEKFAVDNEINFIERSSSDLNSDGRTDIMDLILLKNYILNKGSDLVNDADINRDGTVNSIDVVILKNLLLGSF